MREGRQDHRDAGRHGSRMEAAGAADVLGTAIVHIVAVAGLRTAGQSLQTRSKSTEQHQSHDENDDATTHTAVSVADFVAETASGSRRRQVSVNDQDALEGHVRGLHRIAQRADVAGPRDGDAPRLAGRDRPDLGHLRAVAVSDFRRRLWPVRRTVAVDELHGDRVVEVVSTGFTPAAVIVTVGSVRGWEGSSDAVPTSDMASMSVLPHYPLIGAEQCPSTGTASTPISYASWAIRNPFGISARRSSRWLREPSSRSG